MAPKVLQQLDLAQRSLGQDLLAEDVSELLNRHSVVVSVAFGCAHYAIRSLAQLLGHRESPIADELLIEDVERLAIAHACQMPRLEELIQRWAVLVRQG